MSNHPTPPDVPPTLENKLRSQGLTHGRVVEYVDRMGQPHAAIVAGVHFMPAYAEAGAVNLTVLDFSGETYPEREVPFEGQPVPGGPRTDFWRWPKRVS